MSKTITENGIKVYKNHYCKCGCGERIYYPTTISGINNHKYRGIPDYIKYHSYKNAGRHGDGYFHERYNSACQGQGFIPLNHKNKISNTMHHIDNDFVIFVPGKLHRSVHHSSKTGKNIEEINKLAFEWLTTEWFEKHDIEF